MPTARVLGHTLGKMKVELSQAWMWHHGHSPQTGWGGAAPTQFNTCSPHLVLSRTPNSLGACSIADRRRSHTFHTELHGPHEERLLAGHTSHQAEPQRKGSGHVGLAHGVGSMWLLAGVDRGSGSWCVRCSGKLEHKAEKPRGSAPAHCVRPGVVLSWEAFTATVVYFDPDQARRHRTRHFAAATVVHTVPEADVKHLLPPERRFDLSAFAGPHGRVRVQLVFTSSTPAPSETLSPACAWVLTAETSEPLHPALGRISYCKKHKGASQAWRTHVETAACARVPCVRHVSQWHRSMLWRLSAWHWSCSVWVCVVGSTPPSSPPLLPICPQLLRSDLHVLCT